MELNIFDTADEVLSALAAHFIKLASQAIARDGKFSVCPFRREFAKKTL